jgi:carbonic anhydrase/acetyltransferase-like protein (isoleucine patch superfamily)
LANPEVFNTRTQPTKLTVWFMKSSDLSSKKSEKLLFPNVMFFRRSDLLSKMFKHSLPKVKAEVMALVSDMAVVSAMALVSDTALVSAIALVSDMAVVSVMALVSAMALASAMALVSDMVAMPVMAKANIKTMTDR